MFIFLTTDAFANTISQTQDRDEGQAQGRFANQGNVDVRRPYRGIEIKEDTYAALSVRRSDGSAIPLISSSATPKGGGSEEGDDIIGRVSDYADFILQSVEDQRQEKQQIIETFGDPYVFFFGERPRIMTFSGLLINTADFNWRSQFWANYEQYFRGTRLAQLNARAYISFDTRVVEGYPLTANAVDVADTPYSIPFGLTMLVTNVFDYSEIGSTRFPLPPDGEGGLEVLNQQLQKRRSQFTSSGARVRLRNLLASPGKGILSTIRSGIRAVNDVLSVGGNLIDQVQGLVGGRAVRLPIGVAGFLASTGGAQIAGGSIGGSAILSEEGLLPQFDAATGQFENVNGSVKLRMPTSAIGGSFWKSSITGTNRGFIHENLDEYPNRKQAQGLLSLVGIDGFRDIRLREIERNLAATEIQAKLAFWNQAAEAGGLLNDLAEGVAFARSNFGTVMSAAAFISDPLSGVRASLGIGIGTASDSRVAGRRDELEKQGIKVSANAAGSRSGRVGQYVGFKAAGTFSAIGEQFADTFLGSGGGNQPAEVGDVYNQNNYTTQAQQAADKDYEPAYGNQDFSPLIEQDPSTKQPLDQVFGNNNSAPDGADVDPDSFADVFGTGSSSSSVRSPEEIRRILAQIQSQQTQNDEDTRGIRGVADDDAPILPVV